MAGTGKASMEETEGSCDSENGNIRLKSGEEEDRFSVLPDFLIHRILSLLPATDLVKTLFLSKSWKYQWIRVPVLKFVHIPVLEFVLNDGMSSHKFSNFIDKTLTLHDCSNIEKFVIDFYSAADLPNLDSWIRFAVRKNVKKLLVKVEQYSLPQFLFNSSSIVKLELSLCDVMPIGKVNWESVKSLRLHDCEVEVDKAIENVLSGSPLLEYLELRCCQFYGGFVIASKRLKTLILHDVNCKWGVIEISCPNLERLRISGLVYLKSLKLMNLPSSVYAALDFYYDDEASDAESIDLVQQTLKQVEHVEKLEIGSWMMEILSSFKEDGDCIGGLPDSFIHRIISFFPSAKDASWRHNWTDVPIVPILNFVPNEKFVIYSKDTPLAYLDHRLSLWIRFAARKDVKELILECDCANVEYEYPLPQFLFNNSSLVKMEICACDFMPNGNVNWESLKTLQLRHSSLGNQAIENVLSGSPLLECLELYGCGMEGAIVVASKHLKTFILVEFYKNCHLLEISCPNLESLKIMRYLGSTSLKLLNLPSSLHATLDFYILKSDDISPDNCMNLVGESVKPILHVEELKFELSRLRS